MSDLAREGAEHIRAVLETLGRAHERANVCVSEAVVEYDAHKSTPYAPYPVSGCIVGVPRHIGRLGFSLTGVSFSTWVNWESVRDVSPRDEAPIPCPHCGQATEDEKVTLGFDGAERDDHTALDRYDVETGTTARTFIVGERTWTHLPLTKVDAAKIHRGLYLAYGNDPACGDLWERFREAIGENWWREIVGAEGTA